MNALLWQEAAKAMDKADQALQNAEYDLKGGFYLATSNRAYYACFYAMTALLYTQNVTAKTHEGTHRKFSELFVKTGLLPVRSSEIVSELFTNCQKADYEMDANLTADEAESLVQKAISFLTLVKTYFEDLRAQQENGNHDREKI